MLKCVGCGNNGGMKLGGGVYEVTCSEKGRIRIGEAFSGGFRCDDWKPAPDAPLPDNVRIYLSCGRDIGARDDGISGASDLEGMLGDSFVRIGDIIVNAKEVAAIRYEG